MKILLFERVMESWDRYSLRPSRVKFNLTEKKLIRNEWEKLGRPINRLWRASPDSIIHGLSKGKLNARTACLLADCHPRSGSRVKIYEILELYGWTFYYGRNPPLSKTFVVMQEVFIRRFRKNTLKPRVRAGLMACLPPPNPSVPLLTKEIPCNPKIPQV
jgi:hypothetical protein